MSLPYVSIVLMGGYHGDDYYNDVWRSTDYGATWTEVNASAGWTGRWGHSSVAMPDGSIVLMGGYDGNLRNDVWRSTDSGTTWTEVNTSPGWSERYQYSSVALPDGSIVLTGGSDGGSIFNNTWRSTDNGATWTLMNASSGWTGRWGHSSVAMPDDSIVLMGGYDGSNLRNDVWRSTDSGTTWTQVNASAGWTPRGFHSSVAMPDGSILLTGGQNSSCNTNETWRFQPAGSSAKNPSHTYFTPGTFTVTLQASNSAGYNSSLNAGYITVYPPPVANFTATPRSGTAPFAVSFTDASTGGPTGWAWFFGDENYTAPWTQQSEIADWPARTFHSSVAVRDGSIVLMGGRGDDNNNLNDVWQSTDNGVTWTLMNDSAGWTARAYPSSVAMPDGSIVLMGGYDGSSKNDVWRSTDNGKIWTEMNASPGWTARYGQSSVAMPDGSIVLMGGESSGSYRNDVWRSTDNGATWTRVNASAGWAERRDHSSVAMPDSSIVLTGGYDINDHRMNDVWRSTDYGATWTEVNASAEWTGRVYHSTVALPDGSIVLIGGSGGTGRDVWRSTDNGAIWTLVNASAGWSQRVGYSCVALPDGGIVLTGDNGYLNDTWRFQPAGSSAQDPTHWYTSPGIYTVALQAYNTYGFNSTRKAGYITVLARPNVTAVSPASGSIAGNTLVTVTGTGFTGATAVRFGGMAGSSLHVVSPTQITIRSPAHAAGTVDIKVTTPVGTSAASPADRFTYAARPNVTSITPKSGLLAGNTIVTITGTGFTGASAIRFGTTKNTTPLTVVSATKITVRSPAHAAGVTDVTVTTPGGTSAVAAGDKFTYIAKPNVTSITPKSGPLTGNTAVTIIGTGFTGATAVKFGITKNTTFLTVVSATKITVRSPAHAAGVTDVTVTTPGGTSTTSIADRFTYAARPNVTGISPASGPGTGGTRVTLTGTGFTGATAVKFGTTAGTSLTVNSSTRITITSPAHAAGTVDVRVTTPGGTSAVSIADRFRYT